MEFRYCKQELSVVQGSWLFPAFVEVIESAPKFALLCTAEENDSNTNDSFIQVPVIFS